MTPQEFKAWFDGFTEAFDGKVPTKAQWTRIKERVSEIDGKSVTERVYVDRYWPSYIPYNGYPYWARPHYGVLGGTYSSNMATTAGSNLSNAAEAYSIASSSQQLSSNNSMFDSLQAMADLGRAEAKEIA